MKLNISLLVSEYISYAQEQSPIYKHIQRENLQKKKKKKKKNAKCKITTFIIIVNFFFLIPFKTSY